MQTPPLQKKSNVSRLLSWALFAILMCWLSYMLFNNLGQHAIADYDEARHGVNAYEMIRNNDYLVHTYQGEADYWNLKPPLSFWSIALGYRIFGYSAVGLRFYSAFSMLVNVAALSLFVRKACGKWQSLLLVLIFIGNMALYRNHFARYGDADSMFQLFFTLAMLCMLLSTHDFRWFYGSAVCFSLAFLTKGTHAVNIPLICFLYLIFTGRLKELTWKRILLLLGAGLALIAVWMAARYIREGNVFIEGMFETDVAGRLGSSAVSADMDIPILLYYINAIFRNPAMVACAVVCGLCVVALLVRRAPMEKPVRHAVIGCVLWFAVPIVMFSLANTRYTWYSYAAISALPVLTCLLVKATVNAYSGAWRKGAIACAALFAAALVFMGVELTQTVVQTKFAHSTQAFLRSTLSRDIDSQTHAYIEYSQSGIARIAAQKGWMQADMLTVLLYGDVTCLNGGEEAFLQDSERSVLFMPKEGYEDEIAQLRSKYNVRTESQYWVCFSN